MSFPYSTDGFTEPTATMPRAMAARARLAQHVPPRQTPKQRTLLGRLSALVPGLAASWAYTILARPPRAEELDWQADIRKHSRARRVTLGSRTLAVYEWGTGPTVLLVHDWGGRASQMGRMVEPLVKAGYRVVAFDAPAHGASPGLATDFVEFASAISGLAHELGPLHCVVAHAFGAAMTLYAQRDWGLPAARLALIGSFDHCNWFMTSFGERTGISPDVLERVRDRIGQRYCWRLNWSRLSMADMLRHVGRPTLLVHDEDDAQVPFQHAMSLSRALPAAEVYATSGNGHDGVVCDGAVISRIVRFAKA